MDPGNCFQLLNSQASISDQLYTMLFIAIHTPVQAKGIGNIPAVDKL